MQTLGGFQDYVEIDIEGNPTHRINLEIQDRLPFSDAAFHTVLCLDGLEHLETIHAITEEMFRISKQSVIVSLPNPVAEIFRWGKTLLKENNAPTKFYGLPLVKPRDRHKWFFSNSEAESFLIHFAEKYNFCLKFKEAIFPKARRQMGMASLFKILSGPIPIFSFFFAQSMIFQFEKR